MLGACFLFLFLVVRRCEPRVHAHSWVQCAVFRLRWPHSHRRGGLALGVLQRPLRLASLVLASLVVKYGFTVYNLQSMVIENLTVKIR